MPQAIDLLITGVDVVTFDDPGTVVPGGAIAIKGNTIAWIGPASEASQFAAVDTISGKGMIAMPGLIDGHYHTGQQLLRGKLASIHARHLSKAPHWKRYYVPFESGLDPEDVDCSGIAGYVP